MSAQRFGTVHAAFWTDEKVLAWPDSDKLAALYLLTGPHGTIAGACRLPEAYMAADLGWTEDECSSCLHRLERAGFITYCKRSKWLIVSRRLAYDEPRNQAHMKGVLNILARVPRDHRGLRVIAPLVQELCERHKLEAPAAPYTNGPDPGSSGNGPVTVTRPSPDCQPTVRGPTPATATADSDVNEEESLAPVVVHIPARARATPPPQEAPDGADDGSESAIVARFCHHPEVRSRKLSPEQAYGFVQAWKVRLGHRAEDLAGILAGAMVPGARNPIGIVDAELRRREGVAEDIRQDRVDRRLLEAERSRMYDGGPVLDGDCEVLP